MPGNAQIHHIGHVRPNPAWRIQAHGHPFHELIAPVRGTLHVHIGGHTQSFGPGALLLYPPGVHHEEWSDPDALESYFVAFRYSGLRSDRLLVAEDPDGRIRQIIRWLFQDQQSLPARLEQTGPAFLEVILAHFRRRHAPPESEWVRRVRDHIRRQRHLAIGLDDLARTAGLSRFHFVREYRRLTGRTPMADVRALRADYARELILTTNLPLKEIAPAAGLGNEYSMSRVFQRLFQMPPGAFRQSRGRRAKIGR